MEERLQKVLARAGFASRRGAEALMKEGRVTVNGEIVRELGTKADPARDDIRVDGVRVKAPREPVYILLNKPRGVVTTRRDPSGRQTVMDLVPGVIGLFPVGRLDLTTEGLILLTNDGAFAERVSHPRYEVPRVYHAKVRGVPDARALERLRRGVRVKDQELQADRVRLVEVDRHAWVEVTLHEGKQHEVRRLLEAVGHPVSKLRRVAFGPVTLKGLEPGQFRALRPAEVKGLLQGAKSPPVPPRRPRRRPRPSGARRAEAHKADERSGARGRRKAAEGQAGARKPAGRKADGPRRAEGRVGGRRTGTRTSGSRGSGGRGSAGRGTATARPPARRGPEGGEKGASRARRATRDTRRRR